MGKKTRRNSHKHKNYKKLDITKILDNDNKKYNKINSTITEEPFDIKQYVPSKACDMHVHTMDSIDGNMPVRQVLWQAYNNNVKHISITNHNSLRDLKKALRIKQTVNEFKNMDIITGVELTCIDKKLANCFHLLVYGFDINNKEFNEAIEKIRKSQRAYAYKIFSNLDKMFNIKFSPYEIIKTLSSHLIGKAISWETIAEMAVLHKDKNGNPAPYAKSVNQFIENIPKMIENNTSNIFNNKELLLNPSALIKKEEFPQYFSLDEILPLIKNANGIPVLAHPTQISFKNRKNHALKKQQLRDFVKNFKGKTEAYNLDAGLEVFCPSTNNKLEYWLNIAKENNLIPSGGTDFHGIYKRSDHKIGFINNRYTLTTLPIIQYFNNGRNYNKIKQLKKTSNIIIKLPNYVSQNILKANKEIIKKRQQNINLKINKISNNYNKPLKLDKIISKNNSKQVRKNLLIQEKNLINISNLLTKSLKSYKINLEVSPETLDKQITKLTQELSNYSTLLKHLNNDYLENNIQFKETRENFYKKISATNLDKIKIANKFLEASKITETKTNKGITKYAFNLNNSEDSSKNNSQAKIDLIDDSILEF